MNVEQTARLFRQLFQPQQGLREIDGEMSVPWTAAQWLAFVIALMLLVLAAVGLYQTLAPRLRLYWWGRQQTFSDLLRKIDRTDQLRLTRRMNYGDAIVSISDVVREALRLADRRRGGTGAYRTTGEWVQWSRENLAAEPQREAVTFLLGLSDSLKFSAAHPTLSDVRQATADARALIESLSETTPAAQLAGTEALSAEAAA